MEQRPLGKSGIKVSAVGLGCNNFGRRVHDTATVRAVVHRALDLGVTLFDTADAYGYGKSEEFLGEVLGARRKDIVLATKFGLPMPSAGAGGASQKYIARAVEASLKRLKTDWIDLYQVHFPDPNTPIEETLGALDQLVKQGKVRAIGCSNFSAQQLNEAQDTAARRKLTPFATCQDEYSLLNRDIEQELVPVIEKRRLGVLPFYPLASGLLTGKYKRNAPMPKDARLSSSARHSGFITDRNWGMVEKLEAVAERSGHTMLEFAFGWLLGKPMVAGVIAGATKPEQVEANVSAAARRPSSEVLTEIDRITA
jgi:aryl-alcohol dehydrogenase-like predicted oxidoreductase